METRYCKPWNAGLASAPSAVNKRLGRLLDALVDEINPNIASGQIVKDIQAFKFKLFDALKADGYKITCPKNSYKVTR